MIPILYHSGGDWYFSSMERLWWFVAHYEARDQEFVRQQIARYPAIVAAFTELGKSHPVVTVPYKVLARPVATGGALAGRKHLGRSMRIELSPKKGQ